jgi:ribosomal protein S18 acetylase RimI-like enzyme
MVLADPAALAAVPRGGVQPLGSADLPAMERFYAAAYPDNWFDRRMVETGQYVGVWDGARLLCVAGVHVYSARTRVAALGNIATRPEARRQGLARRATAALCRSLRRHVDTIGLNVHAENAGAIRCYRGLGFAVVTPYAERWLTRIGDQGAGTKIAAE